MDNSLYASELLDTLRVDSWDKFFTRPDIVDYLRDYGIKETFTFLGQTVNVLEYTLEDSAEDYYVTEVDRASGKEIVAFFASVKYNQKRNDLLKPAVGRYQSLVWKHPNSLKGTQFALNFVLKFLLESLPNSTLVTTDMRQSKSGRDLWARIVSYAAKSDRYDCYYGLSARGNKALITVTDDRSAGHYVGDIVAPGSAYAFRSAIITRAGTPLHKFLLDPENTAVVSNEVAEKTGIYTKPQKLTYSEEDQYDYEYYLNKPSLKV